MIKNIEVEFKPTGEELADELCQMDCGQQADFLCELARNLKFNLVPFLAQLQSVADELNCEDDIYSKNLIIRMLKTTLDYIEGEEDNE